MKPAGKPRRGRPPREPDSSSSSSSSTTTRPQGDAIIETTVESDRVLVWRYSSSAGTWNYCGLYEPVGMRNVGLTEFLRLRGGGGKYRARVRRVDGTFGLSTTVAIEGPPRPWSEPDGSSSSSSSAAPAGIPGALDQFLKPFAAAAGAALGAAVVKWVTQSRQTDPLVLELLKRGGGVDPLELQRAIADAESRGEQRGRELGQLTAEREAPDTAGGALGALERGLPAFLEVVNRHLDIEERKVSPRQIEAPAIDSPGEPTTTTTAAPAPARDPLEQLLLGVPIIARKFLLAAAENDEAPEVYASMTVGRLDDLTRKRLPELLERADFADVLIATWPAFADYREWCDGFVVALREEVTAAGADDDDDDASSSSKAVST